MLNLRFGENKAEITTISAKLYSSAEKKHLEEMHYQPDWNPSSKTPGMTNALAKAHIIHWHLLKIKTYPPSHSGRNQIISQKCSTEVCLTVLKNRPLGMGMTAKMIIPSRCPTWFIDTHILGHKYPEYPHGSMKFHTKFQLSESWQLLYLCLKLCVSINQVWHLLGLFILAFLTFPKGLFLKTVRHISVEHNREIIWFLLLCCKISHFITF